MSTLSHLEAHNANISNLTGLEAAINLRTLELHGNSVSDISALAGLTQLNTLLLQNNSISDISALAGLTQLKTLNLSDNSISDMSALAGLTQLPELYLDNNSISDISALTGLTQLTELHLDNNSISDISALTGLTHLKEVYLSHNLVSDISPLAANAGLGDGDTVHLIGGNRLSYASIHTHIPTLQNRGTTVEFHNIAYPGLLKISGDNQKGTAFTPLSQPFVVEVQNRHGVPLVGISVMFDVTAGGGIVQPKMATTNENGRAESTLTLGPNLITNTVKVSAVEIKRTATFYALCADLPTKYLWSIPTGISLIHLPLKVTAVDGVAGTIKSIADLYDALGGADTVNFLTTHDPTTQRWHSYLGDSSRGTAIDKVLTDDQGIIAVMNNAVSLRLSGDALGTNESSSITLHPGTNLVGVPLRDSRIARVSGLFTLDGIGGNVSVIRVSSNKGFRGVRQAGGDDILITGGQSFILMAQQAATVAISGGAWYNISETATVLPPIIPSIEVGDATPVLVLGGSIVGEGIRVDKAGFRVIVKNLSTGKAVSTERRFAFPTVIGDEKDSYQGTFVDIETGRAAQIGDILEISVRFPSPLIGVQPLRYTVTAEDVLRSRIELPALIAYEIPSETELLANYPNPFNPETWIPYRLAEDAFVTLTIYDGVGQVVRRIEVGPRIAAVYESRSKAIHWDGKNDLGEGVASGIYFYTLSAGDYSATRKMVILK